MYSRVTHEKIICRPATFHNRKLTNRKVLDKKSFPCHDALLYIFIVDTTDIDNKNDDGDDDWNRRGSLSNDFGMSTLLPLDETYICKLQNMITTTNWEIKSNQSMSNRKKKRLRK